MDKKFCNQFKCWYNNKAKCTDEKVISKDGKCRNYCTSSSDYAPGER